MTIKIIRHPTIEDWKLCKFLALGTEGKESSISPTEAWKRSMLQAQHSPIRCLQFVIQITDIPYWVVMHLTRHKIGVEHFVQSQRNDRQNKYNRNAARQDTPVNYTFMANAEALINISHRRLCYKAADETRCAWEQVVEAILAVNPEFSDVLIPMCEYRGGVCYEMHGCGKH